jgi:5-methylcytosine-specific restriction endonuclease McrA
MIKHTCSDGTKVSQSTIDRRYSNSLKEKHAGKSHFICQGCGDKAVHNDHTIARARCKQLHKTELIWNPDNYVNSCAKCHEEWETWKTGKYMLHKNASLRMFFMKMHDPEKFETRINNLKQ